MKFFRSKPFFGLLCFMLGSAAMFVAQRYFLKPQYPLKTPLASTKSMDPFLDRFFNDDFFGRSRDPFEEMRRMREGMLKQFEPEGGGGQFDSWFHKKFGGGSIGDITLREDEHFIYYDVSINGLKQDKVNVRVENAQVTISGQVEKKSEEGNTGSYFSSSFHRSFPVPANVDADKVQIEQQKERLVVKFQKVKAPST